MLSIQFKITIYTRKKNAQEMKKQLRSMPTLYIILILALINKDFRTAIIKVLTVKVNILEINGEIVPE